MDKKKSFLDEMTQTAQNTYQINPKKYELYNVKRGLRNQDGSGVLVGLTRVGEVHGYVLDEGEKTPVEGSLRYRGFSITDLVNGCEKADRHGFEEVAYLLMLGHLPNEAQLASFKSYLASLRPLPGNFTEDMILKAPSRDIMNKLARSVLASYSYDDNPDDTSMSNILRQSFELIARMPVMVAHAYSTKEHYFNNKSLILHWPREDYDTAENFLHMIRPDNQFTKLEADILDLCLMLHAEHGGGNNSTFTTHVVSSSGTDTYSAIAAAIGSLKGPKHGGANAQVTMMMSDFKQSITDISDVKQIRGQIRKILERKAFDRSGLVYGIGHAVYTKSDPRAMLLRDKARDLAKEKGREDEFFLYDTIAQETPKLFHELHDSDKIIAPNVDFFSGFVYDMLNIPLDVYTPIFAISRMAGWGAHRIEEIIAGGRIIRPAYKSVSERQGYIPLDQRI